MLNKQQDDRFMLAFGRAYDGLLEGVKDHAKLKRDLWMDDWDIMNVTCEIGYEFDVILNPLYDARTIADLKKLTYNAIKEQ